MNSGDFVVGMVDKLKVLNVVKLGKVHSEISIMGILVVVLVMGPCVELV